MDILQKCRRAVLLPLVDKHMSGVEIGAFARPTVLPSEARVFFADYYTTEQLREQARILEIDPDDVAEVAYILKDTNLEDVLQEPVDFVIANHVVEHLIDPLRWMKNMGGVLKPGGFLFITLPDKKYSFDKFRPDTSLAHFLSDLIKGGESSLEEHCIEAGLLYDMSYVGKAQNADGRLTRDAIMTFSKGWHPGMHVHVFQPETFKDRVLEPLLQLGHLDYSLERFVNNPTIGEFSFVLRQGRGARAWNPSAIYTLASDTQPSPEEVEPTARAPVSQDRLPRSARTPIASAARVLRNFMFDTPPDTDARYSDRCSGCLGAPRLSAPSLPGEAGHGAPARRPCRPPPRV